MVAEGDRVAVRATGSGTRLVANELVGAELVGRAITLDWIAVYRVADSRIVERWAVTSAVRLID